MNEAFRTQLVDGIRTRDFAHVRDVLDDLPASGIAEVLGDFGPLDQAVLFRVLPHKLAGDTFAYLPRGQQQLLIKALGQADLSAVLSAMPDDDRTKLLEELPGNVTRELLEQLSPAERTAALKSLGYPEKSVGRLMTPHYIAVTPDRTVQQVLDTIRVRGLDSETVNVIYVVDDHGKLVDDLRIRRFLVSPPERTVQALMDGSFSALKTTDPAINAVALMRAVDLVALPVVDGDGTLVGIVTADDVLDVAEQAATKQIQEVGGSESLDAPYLDISLLKMLRKRGGWLVILFLSEMLTATAMGFYEKQIERAVVLSLFVPLIISSGGNSGSQAATLIIRALALGEVKLRDWWRVMRREFTTGLGLGILLGVIGFLRITIWSLFSDIYGPYWYLIALTIGFALVGIVLWGSLAGSILPLILKRLGLDPATSSAPFVATLVDVTGLIIYFTVATFILRGTLL